MSPVLSRSFAAPLAAVPAVLALAATLATPAPATAAEAGTWGVRVRATALEVEKKSDAFTALGINFGADAVRIESKAIPEIDVSYWFTEKFVAELVLTVPQEHDVTLVGVGRLGSFKHLPPTLLAQYHFLPEGKFQPYVGLGVNFTLIMDVDLTVAGVPLDLDDTSIGVAAQVGFDYQLSEKLFLNVDVKKVMLASDVKVEATGARLTTADLDPWLLSVGLGWRF